MHHLERIAAKYQKLIKVEESFVRQKEQLEQMNHAVKVSKRQQEARLKHKLTTAELDSQVKLKRRREREQRESVARQQRLID